MTAPSRIPMATRPVGPIQLLSNASFRKYETANRSATRPIRLNHFPAIRLSMSTGAALWETGILGRELLGHEAAGVSLPTGRVDTGGGAGLAAGGIGPGCGGGAAAVSWRSGADSGAGL